MEYAYLDHFLFLH